MKQWPPKKSSFNAFVKSKVSKESSRAIYWDWEFIWYLKASTDMLVYLSEPQIILWWLSVPSMNIDIGTVVFVCNFLAKPILPHAIDGRDGKGFFLGL